MSLVEAPVANRFERKKEETKQKILAVAMALFREGGVAATTMEQIAAQADIAKGTLYNYFPVKEAIIEEYIKRSFRERNSKRLSLLLDLPDTRARIVQLLSILMEGVQAQPEIFEKYHVYRVQKMLSLRQDASQESGFGVLPVEIIKLGQKNGEIRSDLPLDILEDLFDFAFIEAALQFYKAPEQFNARQTIEQCVDLFLNGAGQAAPGDIG